MAKLRASKSQSKLSFLSDTSREYIRCLEKGSKKPSVPVFFNLISVSGLDLKETLCEFVDILNEENEKYKSIAGMEYVRKMKMKKEDGQPPKSQDISR
ncbi:MULTISPECIES: hypothetical protein [unclassified Fibrobacter]|uniref:hypothetical protein n=1 Tax=unclassified Fibrobacter TaxID=2634177 RepID=UPI000D6C81F9|nr:MULTISPECIES: hypothetical protein [unclassified Fibrobacter]